MKHGANKKRCSYEGCTKYAQRGGVCKRHRADVRRKRGSYEEYTNPAEKGGVWKRHKVSVERYSDNGHTGVAQGGVCARHGVNVKRCSHGGCTNQAVEGMGQMLQDAAMKDAPNNAQKEGFCVKHGANLQEVVMKDAPTKQLDQEPA